MESLKRCEHIISNNQAGITLNFGGGFPVATLCVVPQRSKQTKILPVEFVRYVF